MPSDSLDPSPGYAEVKKDNATLASRTWQVFISGGVANGDIGDPGDAFTLNYNEFEGGSQAFFPPEATSVEIRCYLPGTTTQVGDTWTITNTTFAQNRTMHLDDNPLNQSIGSPRAGMFEIHIRVIKNTVPAYEYDSRGLNLTAAGDSWIRGYMRSRVSVASSVMSNVGVNGAEPALFACPDVVYLTVNFTAGFYSSDIIESFLVQDGAEIDKENSVTANSQFTWFYTTNTERIDNAYAIGDLDVGLELDSDFISGNSGLHDEYEFHPTNQQAGWVRGSERKIVFLARAQVDPTVTLEDQVFDQPVGTIFNRGETATGSFVARNARGDGFAEGWSDSVVVLRDGAAQYEETLTFSRASEVLSWSLTFGSSGNVAPADTVGDGKRLEWRIGTFGVSIDRPTTPVFAALSSLLDVVDVVTAYEGTAVTVYNRGETATVTGRLLNRRGVGFEDFTGEVFRSVNASDSSLEETAGISSHDGPTGAFSLTVLFSVSGNDAPATEAGADKLLSWTDTSGNTAADDPLGALSSLLDVTIHLQLNNRILDTALNVAERLPSQLGFYSVRLTNQRGQGKNGALIEDRLQDDLGLVSEIVRSASTATVEGLDGWLDLRAWDSALPGGGWDYWITAGTFEGNAYEKNRSGENVSDFVLLAKNPNNIVICGGGHNTPGEGGLHWTDGNELLIAALMFDVGTQNSIKVDDSAELDSEGIPLPRAYMSVTRLSVVSGQAEFFDSDKTWRSVEANQGSVYQWQLTSVRRLNEIAGIGSVGDERTYMRVFSESDTVGWGESDLFFVTVLYENKTPYPIWGLTGVVGQANGHARYAIDTLALAMSDVILSR